MLKWKLLKYYCLVVLNTNDPERLWVATATSLVDYRGEEWSASDIPGLVQIKPSVPVVWPEIMAAGGLLILVLLLLGWRLRSSRRRRLQGALRCWRREDGTNGPSVAEFRLRKLGGREALITTGTDGGGFLPVRERPFAFRIYVRKDESGIGSSHPSHYEINCLPGSCFLAGGQPKSWDTIYHGDQFEIGGYIFEFHCPRAGTRPGGRNVLADYAPLLN